MFHKKALIMSQEKSNQQENQPAFAIAVQYLKALSMDNTAAPKSFRSDKPDNAAESKSNIKLDVQVAPMDEDDEHYEVQTLVEIVSTNAQDEPRFVLRASYGAIALARHIPEKDKEILLQVETPRLTFPYLRAIIAHATHEAGYPALNLAPIDFMGIYRQKQQKEDEKAEK